MNLRNRAIQWVLRGTGSHPGSQLLLAYADGELSFLRRWFIRAHLGVCPHCLNELEELSCSSQLFSQVAKPANLSVYDLQYGRTQLKASIRAWNASRVFREVFINPGALPGAALQRKVQGELEIYLGARATVAVMKESGGSSLSPEGVLSAADQVLETFLGRNAGNDVVNRVRRFLNPPHSNLPGTAALGGEK